MHNKETLAFHYIKEVAEILHSLNIQHYSIFLVNFEIQSSLYKSIMNFFTLFATLLDLQNIIEALA